MENEIVLYKLITVMSFIICLYIFEKSKYVFLKSFSLANAFVIAIIICIGIFSESKSSTTPQPVTINQVQTKSSEFSFDCSNYSISLEKDTEDWKVYHLIPKNNNNDIIEWSVMTNREAVYIYQKDGLIKNINDYETRKIIKKCVLSKI